MDAELVFDRQAGQVVARARPARLVRQELRYQKQRDALRARRRAGQAGEHEMDDVFCHVVFAIGDENLLPRDPVAAVARGFGPGLERADV